MPNCPFCDLKGQDIIAQNEKVFAIEDIKRDCKTHLLIIPRQHFRILSDIEDLTLLAMMKLSFRLADKLKNYRLVINTRDRGKEDVAHAHIHLLSEESYC